MRNPLKIIRLSAGTTQINFIAYLIACLYTISIFVFFNSMQTFVLSINLQVPSSQLASTGGSLVFYDQLLSILLLGTWGVVSDKMGRRVIFVLGFLIMGVGILGFSYAKSVFPELLMWRLCFAVGAAAASGMVTAVLADYVHEMDKGKVSGLVGLMSGLGALIGVFVFGGIPPWIHGWVEDLSVCLNYAYLIIGSITIFMGLCLAFTLRAPEEGDIISAMFGSYGTVSTSPPEYESVRKDSLESSLLAEDTEATADENEDLEKRCPFASSSSNPPLSPPASSCPFSGAVRSPSQETLSPNEERMGCTMPGMLEQPDLSYRSFWSLAMEGFKLIKTKPTLLLAYLGGFVARGDSIIITLFLPLWINKYYIDNGTCKPVSSNDIITSFSSGEFKDPQRTCDIAFRKAFAYTGIAQTFALIGAPIFGFLSDRLSKTAIFLTASILSFAGYFPLSFINDPIENKIMYLLMVVLGIGEIGMIVTSLSLATYGMPKDVRGSISGCYSLFGGLGILIMTSLGGILADTWVNGPFFVVGVLSGLISVAAVLILMLSKYDSRYFNEENSR